MTIANNERTLPNPAAVEQLLRWQALDWSDSESNGPGPSYVTTPRTSANGSNITSVDATHGGLTHGQAHVATTDAVAGPHNTYPISQQRSTGQNPASRAD